MWRTSNCDKTFPCSYGSCTLPALKWELLPECCAWIEFVFSFPGNETPGDIRFEGLGARFVYISAFLLLSAWCSRLKVWGTPVEAPIRRAHLEKLKCSFRDSEPWNLTLVSYLCTLFRPSLFLFLLYMLSVYVVARSFERKRNIDIGTGCKSSVHLNSS